MAVTVYISEEVSRLIVGARDRANHTGTQTADTISDFAEAVHALGDTATLDLPDGGVDGQVLGLANGRLAWITLPVGDGTPPDATPTPDTYPVTDTYPAADRY